MASSFSLYKIPFPISNHQPTIIRSQRFTDEENDRNRVDANMAILSKRIKVQRMKERLNESLSSYESISGWNYKAVGYVEKNRRRYLLSESFEIAGLVGSTICLVFLSGSIFVYLFSLLILP